MSDAPPSFDFSQFVPGFDFLKNLTSAGAKAGAVPGMPSMSSWVAPTLSVEEVDKRIQELKTVQYWLEQNGHALKATIQALEVQKMTLSTLRGMNVRMEDLASAFTRAATPPAASSAPAAAAAPAPTAAAPQPEAPSADEAKPAAGVVDPMQWWGALTQQFQQIATTALQEASHLKMPAMAQPMADAMNQVSQAVSGAVKAAASKPSPRKPAARKKPAVKKAVASPRRSSRGRPQ
ncbi:MAG: PhaM family polyhydroxyalkanoate granule multifunctional regulatory protein [Pseudomonadota bacterium]